MFSARAPQRRRAAARRRRRRRWLRRGGRAPRPSCACSSAAAAQPHRRRAARRSRRAAPAGSRPCAPPAPRSLAFGSLYAATTCRRRRCRRRSASISCCADAGRARPPPTPAPPLVVGCRCASSAGRPPSSAATRRRAGESADADPPPGVGSVERTRSSSSAKRRSASVMTIPSVASTTTFPLLITVRIVAAPTRTRSIAGPSTITASICLPGSRLPTRSWRSSDHAALIVAATSASSNVRSMPKQASVIANGIDGENPPPGLTSVASATGNAAVDQHAGRREAAELEVERGDRQQRGDDARRRQRAAAPAWSTKIR